MEIHHHSHPPPGSLHGKRKKLAHYFWEFLMLLLAVFCGFLAEYQLEHLIEHQREKQYIKSLVADLKADQQILTAHIEHLDKGSSMMDSVILFLNNPPMIANNSGQLYYLARLAPRLNPLSVSNRTFEQLKNSGNFRLIRDITTSNKIMSYYEKFPLIRMLETINESEFNDYKRLAAKIFDPAVFMKMQDENGNIIRTTENPALRTNSLDLLQELSVFAVYMHGTKKGILVSDKELKDAGSELINYLQQQYHLE
jgi:hypothetical protein